MEDLPEELIQEIMLAVPYEGLRGVLSVNKMTYKISQSRHFWEKRALADLGVTSQIFRDVPTTPQLRYLQLRNKSLMREFFSKIYELGCTVYGQQWLLYTYRDITDPLTGNVITPYLEFYDLYSSLPEMLQREMQGLRVISKKSGRFLPPRKKLIELINDLESEFTWEPKIPQDLMDSALYYLVYYSLL